MELLRSLFDLTPSEARVARGLAAGDSLDDIAASGSVSRNTVRSQLQQVLEKANKVIKQVAETEKYDAVLQEAVYINPKYDITDKVIKALNATTGAK